MIIKINAEMDSMETAELAARTIRHRTDGILSIKIHKTSERNTHEDYGFTNSIFPYYVPVDGISQASSNNFLGGFVNLRDDYPEYDTREVPRSVIIDVICEQEAEKTVMQVFTSLGGLKINKN